MSSESSSLLPFFSLVRRTSLEIAEPDSPTLPHVLFEAAVHLLEAVCDRFRIAKAPSRNACWRASSLRRRPCEPSVVGGIEAGERVRAEA